MQLANLSLLSLCIATGKERLLVQTIGDVYDIFLFINDGPERQILTDCLQPLQYYINQSRESMPPAGPANEVMLYHANRKCEDSGKGRILRRKRGFRFYAREECHPNDIIEPEHERVTILEDRTYVLEHITEEGGHPELAEPSMPTANYLSRNVKQCSPENIDNTDSDFNSHVHNVERRRFNQSRSVKS
jgi:hypothetical protein